MTSDRPYREAMSVEEALAEIRRCSSTQFAPGVVSVFLKMHRFDEPDSEDTIFVFRLAEKTG